MYHKSQEPPQCWLTETVTRPLRTAEIGRLNYNTSEDATAFQPKILYHLRNSYASGTLVPCWLLFLYPFLHTIQREGDAACQKK